MRWDGGSAVRFTGDTVSEDELRAILGVAAQAPSPGNSQPWRFVVVRESVRREHVARASGLPPGGAPVFVIACARPGPWEEIVSRLRGRERPAREAEVAAWINRHVSVALTYMMVTAKAMGWDVAPCERFDAGWLRETLSIPPEAGIVAVVAIGRLAARPDGWRERLEPDDLVAMEQWAPHWSGAVPAGAGS